MLLDEAYLRHALYYIARLGQLGLAYKDRTDALQSLSDLALDWAQIESGQRWAVSNYAPFGRKCCSDYARVAASLLSLRQSAADRVLWLTHALEAARYLNDIRSQAEHLGNLGIAYEDLGRFELSRDSLCQAIDLDVICQDANLEQLHAGQLGLAYIGLAKYQDASKYLTRALSLATRLGNLPAQGIHFGNLGLLYGELGDYPEAIEMHKRALKISREVGDRRGEGRDIGNLGVIYYQTGLYPETENCFQRSLAICRQLGDRYGEALDLSNLTGLYETLCQYEKAVQAGEEALKVCSAIGASEREGQTLTSLGLVSQRLRLYDVAEAFIRRAIDLAEATRDTRGKAFRLRALAETEFLSGDWKRAARDAQESRGIAHEIGTKDIEADALTTLAAIDNATGHFAAAIQHADRALAIGRELGTPHMQSAARHELERACVALGKERDCVLQIQNVVDRKHEEQTLSEAPGERSELGTRSAREATLVDRSEQIRAKLRELSRGL